MSNEAVYQRDPLTGSYKYDALPQLLIDAVGASTALPRSVALLIIDIDRFKWLVADHGMMAGDRFLVEVTSALRSNIPANASVIRSAGDEFTIVLPNVTAEQASQIAHSLLEAIEKHTTRVTYDYEDSVRELRGTISIGAAVAGIGNIDEIQSLLYWIAARGYSALRDAKKFGQNRVEVRYWMPPSQVSAAKQSNG